MLYMIGGPSSVGKSALAKALSKKTGISIMSTDALTDALAVAGYSTIYGPEKAEWFFAFLEAFITRNSEIFNDYIIEGDAFFPKQIKQLRNKHPLKAIFLINTAPDWNAITKHRHTDRWMDNYSKAKLSEFPERIQTASISINKDCQKYKIPCIDIAQGFESAQKDALAQLLN